MLKLQAALAYMFNAGSARGIACPVDSRTGFERILSRPLAATAAGLRQCSPALFSPFSGTTSPGVSSRELRNGRLMVRGHTADSGLYKEGFPPPLALLRKSGRH
ncbi:hypothetical protein PRIPAC_71712 [Pristionchus pacificus]|uniref:Uncharacterized protein n=1 Tax=Pristionchus pacificus TaxID=54126 RepID=A0A2A6B536_PRIPA|nr:hypothetical protein PRIPAC_71712 [Pristionchus pacificus]|eukprot:PDM60971.1 hypothetical protein PRIPAC_54777 [Pristionchus pacificus]